MADNEPLIGQYIDSSGSFEFSFNLNDLFPKSRKVTVSTGEEIEVEFEPGLYWLSFCNPDLSAGSQFLGVSIVWGTDYPDAISNAWRLKCNPGGEIMGELLPEIEGVEIPIQYINRLLTRSECDDLNALMVQKVKEAQSG